MSSALKDKRGITLDRCDEPEDRKLKKNRRTWIDVTVATWALALVVVGAIHLTAPAALAGNCGAICSDNCESGCDSGWWGWEGECEICYYECKNGDFDVEEMGGNCEVT